MIPSTASLNPREWFESKKNIILDLDGVVYHGNEAIPGAVEAIEAFRKAGKKLAFLTNNSAKTPISISKKLNDLGIPVEGAEIVTSGYAAALWFREARIHRDKPIYVCGTSELASVLRTEAIEVTKQSELAGAILVGMDQEFNYTKIVQVLPGLIAGVPLVACNRDSYYPVGPNRFQPGCGAAIGAIEGACGRSADFEIGKPNVKMLDLVCDRFGFDIQDSVMVGDTLTSDIVMANKFGMDSVWITENSHVRMNCPSWIAPTFSCSSLANILN